MSDGKLKFDTQINKEGFTEGISELEKITAKKSKSMGTAFEKTGAKLTSFITKPALVAAGSLASLSLVKGFSRLKNIDTAKAQLEGLGHSAAEVKTIMDSAMESVKGTAYGFDEAAKAAASAVAAGIEPGKELTRYLSLVGDAAAQSKLSFTEMGSIFNKVMASGKISMEEVNQLADQGIPIYKMLSEQLGVTQADVREMVSAGKVDSETFLKAIETNIGGAAKVIGEKSFTGALANIGASLGRIGANFLDAGGKGGGFFSQLKPLMVEAMGSMSKLEEKAAEWGETFGKSFAAFIKILKAVPAPMLGIGAAAAISAGPTMKLAGKLMKTFSSVKKAIGAMNKARVAVLNYKLATEGASLAAGVANGQLTKQQAAIGKLSQGARSLWSTLKAHPFLMVAAAAAGLSVAIYKGVEAMHAETNAAKEAARSREKAVESVKAQNAETDLYYNKLKELEGVENKTSQQKQLMQAYVDKLNESVDGLNLTYDAERDRLDQTTEAIYKKIEAQKQEAVQDAYLKNAKKALEDYAKTEIKIADVENERAQKKAKLNELSKKGSSISYEEAQKKAKLKEEIRQLNREYDDLTAAQTLYAQEAMKATNMATIQSGAWDTLLKEAGKTAKQLPQTLISGINSGKYAIPATVESLNEMIKFDKAVQQSGMDGTAIALKLSEGIAGGTINAEEATKQLIDASGIEMKKGEGQAKKSGVNTGSSHASGIKSQSGKSKNAGRTLGTSAKSGAGSVSLYSTGRNIGTSFASGMRSALEEVRSAANQIADIADRVIKKKQQINSPSKLQIRNGMAVGEGLAIGVLRSVSLVKAASAELSKAATISVAEPTLTYEQAKLFKITDDLGARFYRSKTFGEETAAPGSPVYNQNNYFYRKEESPIETARALKNQNTFGLAGGWTG